MPSRISCIKCKFHVSLTSLGSISTLGILTLLLTSGMFILVYAPTVSTQNAMSSRRMCGGGRSRGRASPVSGRGSSSIGGRGDAHADDLKDVSMQTLGLEDRDLDQKHETEVPLSTRLRAHHPTWIPERFWHQMIDEVWDTERWKHTSRVNKAIRNTEFEGVSSRHTGESISTAQHRYQMRRILGREPSTSEVYERVHCTNRKLVPGSSNPPTDPPQYIYPKAARVAERFRELRDAAHSSAQPDTPPPDGASLWDQSIGGRKKGRYFGLGDSYYSEYSNSSGRSSTTGSSMEVVELKEKMIRMEAEAKEREDRYIAQLESEQKRREDLETEHANQVIRLAEQVALSSHFASFMQQQGYNFPPPGPPSPSGS